MGASGRPASVSVVGWVFILVAGFMLLTGGASLAAALLVERAGGGAYPAAFEGAPAMFHVAVSFIAHFGALAALEVVAAVAVFVAAVKFMKLRAWARTALEAFTWLSVFFLVAAGIVLVNSWMKMASGMPPALTAPLSPRAFTVLGAALWGAFIMALIVCAGFVLSALRAREVREAVS